MGTVRWLFAEVAYVVQSLGYWIRPYDMLADRRRWRWQRRTPCARQVLTEEERQRLAKLLES
jgi:predicted DCC family thiol-disulfide oxidoreductase YuxK